MACCPVPDPNNTYLEHFALVFMPICKAANTTLIRNATAQMGKTKRIDHIYPTVDRAHIAAHLMGTRTLRITFVRSPWARLVSLHADKFGQRFIKSFGKFDMTPDMPFDAFVRRVCETTDRESVGSAQHWRSAWHDLTYRGELLPNCMGRVETIGLDWPVMRERAHRHCKFDIMGELTHRNPSHHGPLCDYYTPELRDLVGQRYELDTVAFGYDFNRTVGRLT